MTRRFLYMALLGLCVRASAADLAAPSPFELHFVPAIRASLAADPFFGSKLVGAFDGHMTEVARAPDARAAAEYLKSQVAQVRLGKTAMTETEAGAVLAAGALAAPRQFNAAVSKLEAIKPGLGEKLVASFKDSSGRGSYQTATALTKAGESLRVSPDALTYNARGGIEHLFDGR
jgi:hypothetical protein